MTVKIEACECGRVPLNDRERERCPKCDRVQQLAWRMGETEWRPILRSRVVWHG